MCIIININIESHSFCYIDAITVLSILGIVDAIPLVRLLPTLYSVMLSRLILLFLLFVHLFYLIQHSFTVLSVHSSILTGVLFHWYFSLYSVDIDIWYYFTVVRYCLITIYSVFQPTFTVSFGDIFSWCPTRYITTCSRHYNYITTVIPVIFIDDLVMMMMMTTLSIPTHHLFVNLTRYRYSIQSVTSDLTATDISVVFDTVCSA